MALFAVIPFVMGLTCGEPVPLKEMSMARAAITRALSVKADTYAPAELEEARKSLIASHDSVRDDAPDRAKDSAVTAHKKANEAYEKSLPLLAKDTMDAAEKSLVDAGEAYAPVLAKEEYEQAQALLKKAGEQFEDKKYRESIDSAMEADRLAKNARNGAIGKQDILRDAIEEVKATVGEAKKYNAAAYAPDKVKSAEDDIHLAAEALSKKELRKGFAAMESGKVAADEAYVESIKRSAQEDLIAAEILVAKAEKSEGAKEARDELEGARELIAGSKAQYADSRFRDSLISSAEAKRLAAFVIAAKPSDNAVKEKDAATPKKELGQGPGEEPKEYKTYRVKYNPSRRDCLWRIAGRYYNNPRLWKKIYEANRDKIGNPHLIHPGMSLRIPVSAPSRKADKKDSMPAIKPEKESIDLKEDSDKTVKKEGAELPRKEE
jgi:nucleoid-associated protein YgaU